MQEYIPILSKSSVRGKKNILKKITLPGFFVFRKSSPQIIEWMKIKEEMLLDL